MDNIGYLNAQAAVHGCIRSGAGSTLLHRIEARKAQADNDLAKLQRVEEILTKNPELVELMDIMRELGV